VGTDPVKIIFSGPQIRAKRLKIFRPNLKDRMSVDLGMVKRVNLYSRQKNGVTEER